MPEPHHDAAGALRLQIRERLPAARVQAAVGSATPSPQADRLLQRARVAVNVGQRVHWLHQAADARTPPLALHAACLASCTRCCHIELAMTDIEALEIGVRPSPVPDTLLVKNAIAQGERAALPGAPHPDGGYAAPSPFLAGQPCSIHAWRPLMCRVPLNLDRDDLLCRLEPGPALPVPYADLRPLKGLYLLAQPAARLAEFQPFFPQGLGARA